MYDTSNKSAAWIRGLPILCKCFGSLPRTISLKSGKLASRLDAALLVASSLGTKQQHYPARQEGYANSRGENPGK